MKQQISTLQGYDLWAKWYDLEKNVLIYLDELYRQHREHSIKKLLKSKNRALDVCCGSGRHLPVLENYFKSVTGVDLSTQMLASAMEKADPLKTALYAGDFLSFIPSAKCDFINCSLALMHFRELKGFCKKAAELLAPGGILYLVDAPATFLEKGFTPHIHRNGKKIILDHVAHAQMDVEAAVVSAGLEIVSQTNLKLDPQTSMEIPEFSKFKDFDCLYVLIAKKGSP